MSAHVYVESSCCAEEATMVYQVPLDGVTFSLSSKIASFYVSHIWYEGVTLASHGRGKSQNTRYANDVAEFV